VNAFAGIAPSTEPTPPAMTTQELEEIRALIGEETTLLPIRKGGKKPSFVGWNKLTPPETRGETYRAKLLRAPAIGVLLGIPSGGLCSIDLDSDEEVEPFLALNPKLRTTLRTRGVRGCNLWLRIIGDNRKSFDLKKEGRPVGEWRADGRQTVIAGAHPSGGEYRFLHRAPPVEIRFEEIEWGSFTHPRPPNSSVNSECSVNSTSSVSSIYGREEKGQGESPIQSKIRAGEAGRKELDGNPRRRKLYERWIAKVFTPAQGERNTFLVKMLTFLYRTVSPSTARELSLAFYRSNAEVFLDSEEQHARETDAHLALTAAAWREGLTSEEAGIYRELEEQQSLAVTFRICRDLAFHDENRGRFFLSCNELAARLGETPPMAQLYLSSLEGFGILRTVEKGTRYRKGVKAKATVWEWLLAPPPPPPDAEAGEGDRKP
jgi:hypothetical protein